MLHRLWSRAVGMPGYDKGEWKALRALIEGRDVSTFDSSYGRDYVRAKPQGLLLDALDAGLSDTAHDQAARVVHDLHARREVEKDQAELRSRVEELERKPPALLADDDTDFDPLDGGVPHATTVHALRLVYRMSLWLRGRGRLRDAADLDGGALSIEASKLLADLPGGSIDMLAEAVDGDKPSDQAVR